MSGFGFTPDSDKSSEAFEKENTLDIEETHQELEMPDSGPADTNAAAEANRLSSIREKVEYKVFRLRPDRITASHIATTKDKLSDILSLAEEYGLGMTTFLKQYPGLEGSFRLQYKDDLDKLHSTVDDIEDIVCEKIHQLEIAQPSVVQPTAVVSHGGQGQTVTQPSQAASASLTKDATVAKAIVKYTTLLDLALSTSQDMDEDGLYLETATNEKIQKLVMKISRYEKTRDKIKASHTEYLEFTAIFKPDPIIHDQSKLNEAVEGAIFSIETLIKSLENEDDERELATLLPRKSEKVKWPNFSGKPGESLFKFKEQFFKAARQNQTNRDDQFTKLRENLRDFPLTLVPESMNDVQKAFKRLSDTYGDPQKLVNFELKKLEKLSMFPNCDDGLYTMGTRDQAEWLLQVETVLTEMIKMASEDDADRDLKRSVYGPQTSSTLLAKFPLILKQKLISAAKADPVQEKLAIFKAKLKEWSEQALEMEKYLPEVKVPPKKSVQQVQFIKDTQVHVFTPPKPLPTCLICVELQKKHQVSPQLPHLSAHVTGCPKFVEMNIVTRTAMCNTLKLCKLCLREDSPGHEKFCMVLKIKNKNKGKTKYEFTCKEEFCHRHMWICTKHKSLNQESMDIKASQLDRDHGLKLVHFLGWFSSSQSSARTGQMPGLLPDVDPYTSQAPRPQAGSKAFRHAEKKLRQKARKSGGPVEIVPVPEGEPMFMFQAIRGNLCLHSMTVAAAMPA